MSTFLRFRLFFSIVVFQLSLMGGSFCAYAQQAGSVADPMHQLKLRINSIETRLNSSNPSSQDPNMLNAMIGARNKACKELIKRGSYSELEQQVLLKGTDQVISIVHPFAQCQIKYIAPLDFGRMSESKKELILSEPEKYRIF
jgi:hypothetical protein